MTWQGTRQALWAADKLSKLIPFEPGMTLQKALEDEPQLGEFIDSSDEAQEIMDMAFRLEGLAEMLVAMQAALSSHLRC